MLLPQQLATNAQAYHDTFHNTIETIQSVQTTISQKLVTSKAVTLATYNLRLHSTTRNISRLLQIDDMKKFKITTT